MKLIIASALLLITATSGWAGQNNIMTLDDLNKKNMQQNAALNTGSAISDLHINKQGSTETITQQLQAEQKPSNFLQDNGLEALKWGAGAAGLGLTYLYGPTALFWGTYYGVSWGMGQLGITGVTALCAATKAGVMAAGSPAAQTALAAAGGLVAKHGAAATIATAQIAGKLAVTGATYAAKGGWALGNYAYNWYLGTEPTTEPVAKQQDTVEQKREKVLQAFENRQIQGRVDANFANHAKLVKVLGA